jgi:two-component sensor histidine kinase
MLEIVEGRMALTADQASPENRPVSGEEVVAGRPGGKRVAISLARRPDESDALSGTFNLLERSATEDALRASEARLVNDLAAVNELQRISTELIREQDVRRLYSSLVDAAVTLMRSDFATMQMLHPDRGEKGELQLLAFRGFDPEAVKFWEWVRADSGCTCGRVLHTGRRAVATDVATCDFMAGTPDRDALLNAGVAAAQSTPLVSRSGRLLGMISTHWRKPHSPAENEMQRFDILARLAADLIERKQNEDQIKLLGREAEHRARNVLATVQAIVHLTHADSLKDYKAVVEGRIRALANTESLFAKSGGAGAELRKLVLQELLPYGQIRIEVDGADLSLEPVMAQTFALCLHELTTNAAKHGALSVPAGRVRVEWSRPAEGQLSLRWSESGGPPVERPTHRGFGTKMLSTFMEMKGKIEQEWRPEGLRCEITMPYATK